MGTPVNDATSGEEIYQHPSDYDLELAAQHIGDLRLLDHGPTSRATTSGARGWVAAQGG